MDNLRIDDSEHISNSDPYAEKDTCLLEESDTQCGYIFFNKITRLLKFYCTYCRETYDNVEYFCQHLSGHINESNEFYTEIESLNYKHEVEEKELIEVPDGDSLSLIFLKDEESKTNSYISSHKNDTRDAFEYENELEDESNSNENINSDDILYNLNAEEMLIEEIGDADDILAEVEQEMLDQSKEESHGGLFVSESSYSPELLNGDEKQNSSTENSNQLVDNSKNGNSFEECFIKETNIDKIRSEGVCVLKEKNQSNRKPMQRRRSNIQDLLRLKRRRRKVTTVKVIAVKNRIAELYERIHSEQQKSSQFFSNDFTKEHNEQETQDAVETLINDETDNKTYTLNNSNQSLADEIAGQSTSEISRKIIGETLITLIPEGTKIPDKLPSSVNTPQNNELNKKTHLPITNAKYIHDKKENIAVCPACGKTFRSHFSLTIHKRIHYLESDSSVKLAHKCSDCDQLFNKLSQLKHHVETVHYPDGFICKICNRQLSSLSLLERHMVKVHLDRPFNCKKCNKNFSDPLTYEEHLASHNSGEIFKCSTCGRKYSTEYFLLEHMRNHKEQVPQTCVVCGKITLRITQHMKIHTPRPKRLLSCTECGKVFNFSSGLSHHFKIMHKLPRPPPKPKKEAQNCNTFKRKRRSHPKERNTNKKKQLLTSNSSDSAFITDEKLSNQIIEEQMEIPHDGYDTSANIVTSHLDKKEENTIIEQSIQPQSSSHAYSVANSHVHQQQVIIQNFHQDAVINHKEEEAKRVIVELIQNSSYTSFFPDNFSSVLDVAPPIAREETISAVNSIVHEC